MATSQKDYGEMAKKASPPSPKGKDFLCAFLIGGGICTFGQCLILLYSYFKLPETTVKALVPMTIIVITAILTGTGVFDKIAKHAGAGTLVPITGFANSIVSPAMEFSAEGRILGTGAKLFSIAGPVIAYGTFAATIYGLIAYLLKLY